MAAGPGKYDDICTMARVATDAEAVVLIVLRGHAGSGFSVQAVGEPLTHDLPRMLRSMADEIERGIKEPTNPEPRATI